MAPTNVKPEAGKRINIFINDERYVAPNEEMKGQELSDLAGIPAGNHIFLEVPGPAEDRQIQSEEVIRLRSGMKFYDVPVGNLG